MLFVRKHTSASELTVITTFFNWCGFESKIANYLRFSREMDSLGIQVLTVECANWNCPFSLPPGPNVIHTRTNSALWQKERLLNIAINHLPHTCRFVAWIDCDLLFLNHNWASEASQLLEHYAVVQLFDDMIRLGPGETSATVEPTLTKSFMDGVLRSAEDNSPMRLGHPGFAWAARRDILETCNGLYDACIVGGADCAMAHAWFGTYACPSVAHIAHGEHRSHYQRWARKAHSTVAGSVSLVRGRVLHLWHGSYENRQYAERHEQLASYSFEPDKDIASNSYGCWEWNSEKPELHNWMLQYFVSRHEDSA
jgi:hypothetical protein